MIESKDFRITKKIDPEDLCNKLDALGEAYQCFFQVPNYDLEDEQSALMGMELLYKETLVELKLLLLGEQNVENNYIKKAEQIT